MGLFGKKSYFIYQNICIEPASFHLTVASKAPQCFSAQQRTDNLWRKYAFILMCTTGRPVLPPCSSVCHLLSMLKEKRHVTKHLFSDTDTDNITTELSWLRESSRKSKPKVTKYSRQPPIKAKAVSPHTSCTSLH